MLEKVSSPKFQLDSDTEEHFTEFKIDHLKQRIFYPTLYSIQVNTWFVITTLQKLDIFKIDRVMSVSKMSLKKNTLYNDNKYFFTGPTENGRRAWRWYFDLGDWTGPRLFLRFVLSQTRFCYSMPIFVPSLFHFVLFLSHILHDNAFCS